AHPSYNSGHSGVSGSSAAVLAAFFGSDTVPFSFSSDGLPGATRSYTSFSATAQEASDSRVYAGIHWRFDVATGQVVGNEVGNYVVTHNLLPVSRPNDDGGTAVTLPSQVQPGAPAGVISLVRPLAAPMPADAPDSPPLGAPPPD